jgi:hypothetical protein
VTWPRRGTVQTLTDVPMDAIVRVVEGEAKGERLAIPAPPGRR